MKSIPQILPFDARSLTMNRLNKQPNLGYLEQSQNEAAGGKYLLQLLLLLESADFFQLSLSPSQ
jgi:hypothetical protein